MANIPFVDLAAQYRELKPRIDARIQAVLDHGQFIMGPEVGELERELARFTGAPHAISVSSGTDALLMALMALEIGPGDAVFLPAFTFTATAEVAVLAGASPVFVDVDPDTFNVDPGSLRAAVQRTLSAGELRPRALIAVDLFGLPADYAALGKIADEFSIEIIADAAQSFGARAGETRVGSLARVTATSFFPAKPLGAYGDGGAIFTTDDELAEVLRSIRAHGKGTEKYEIVRLGLNGRLDTLQAAILLPKLEAFPAELEARDRLARTYDAALSEAVRTPVRIDGVRSAWAQYSVLVDDRDGLAASLQAAGIPFAIYYPVPMHLQEAYREHGHGEGSLPVSESLSRRILSLPMHPYMDDATAARICDAVVGAAR